ncbi:MAG TPA: hypothetical protein DEF43_06360 [Chloroflexus aurantiacus]|uniref:Conserved repeat domain protein n=1 Tax=Chloroflexus aurantiacus (strain ATCC 29366 / DSM 635 / J-10-fl) TaxID=324602 RepID=A9WBC7_CHLAA|nr:MULTISPECIES: right-handed parallel beta-helix repeat-containing protein [Chloroflexus]ABY33334.1 conserved repeat domain protein [Chloroflexus aurantiacus J-10-fl]HBW66780.1 hypothetical protein [Chloroflexus aurantiacus]
MRFRINVWAILGTTVLVSGFLLASRSVWSATIPVLPPPHTQAVISVCDPITTDTTWTTGNVYVVGDCALVVQSGATLTIQPGVIVKFFWVSAYGGSRGGGIRVDGRLIAQGTADQPIVFTSLADDSAGGDTNGNGPSSGAPGDWHGLILNTGSQTTLDHVSIRYAGGNLINSSLDGWSEAQIEVKAGAQFSLTNSEVRDGGRIGIYLNGAGLSPTIQHVQLSGHTATGSSYGYTVLQSTINMQPTYSNLTFSNNTRNEVTIGSFEGEITQNATLGGTNFGATCGSTLCQLIIPNGRTLTIRPGTRLALGPAFGITIASGGTLNAEGTATQPVIFTSAAAATTPPGGTVPSNSEWLGLWAQAGSTLRLAYCDISYATDSNYGNGGLEINTDDAQVQNCKIHHNKRTGLYLASKNNSTIRPVLSNVEVSDNGQYGVYLEAQRGTVLAPTWEGGAIRRNGWSGIFGYTYEGILEPTLRNLTIAGNGASGGLDREKHGIYFNNHNINPVLEGVSFNNNTGAAVLWYCNGSITARNLTATGNTQNELVLPGCDISGGRRWDLGDAGIPVRVAGDINVTPNALLSILSGTILRFDKNQYNSPTWLEVQDQATLNASGTVTRPVVFTGATQTPGWWIGIQARQRATLMLRHCEIGYGGAQTTGSLLIRWGYPRTGIPVANIQNCEIHHSSTRGVHFYFDNEPPASPPVFRYNHLHDNAELAVAAWGTPPIDARYNYWGHATGPYHATQNPTGQGNGVGDNILFYPWLSAPSSGEVAGEMIVRTGAPTRVSPGETVDYAIQYYNGMSITVENAVLLIQLPRAAEYVDSTGGGIYWSDRHQVFWKLGDLLPQAEAFVSVRVRFQWGLPADYKDGSITLLAADNYNAGAFNTAEYLAHQMEEVITGKTIVSQTEFDALRRTVPDLQTLYEEAIAQGYRYLEAGRITYDDGTSVTGAVFRTPDRRAVRLLTLYEGMALAMTSADGLYTLHDTTGGITMTLNGLSRSYWGDWMPGADSQTVGLRASTGCSVSDCNFNCIGQQVNFKVMADSLTKMFMWTIATGGSGGTVALALEVLDVTKMIYDCYTECEADPNSNCCTTTGQVRWTVPGWSKLLGDACVKEECNGTTGTYGTPGVIYCAGGQRCVAGYGNEGGCKSCVEATASYSAVSLASPGICAAGETSRCSELELLRAKDPNDITGPTGDLLPGQVVTYTIRYENEGEGRAYGVFVVNPLPAVFDERTLTFVHGSGQYLTATREIVWTVGELAPKGQAGSSGVLTYTVALTNGLPSGTVVANQATVYFPSVPEETPTNTWVNVVTPLVAEPQSLTTAYMAPLPITLSGREVSGLPLTYEIVDRPHGGTLTGTAPNLTYTPGENFTGADAFTFRVSNGTSTSRAAQISVMVTAQGDTTSPRVLWTSPADGAKGVVVLATPVYTDTAGPIYVPEILVGMSEPLDATTVTTTTVILRRSDGTVVPAWVRYDAAVHQIVMMPRTVLANGTYRAEVTTGVKDSAGNTLSAPYTIQFTVGSERKVYVPVIQR